MQFFCIQSTRFLAKMSKKSKSIILDAKDFKFNNTNKFRYYEIIILENFEKKIDEKSLFSLINFVDQTNKYLLINSLLPISEIEFDLKDLKSRSKNCLVAKIEKPDDKLIKVLISKYLSDRQVLIDKKLIDYTTKRITRSYGKIFEFIYKIDEISLKKKKSIDLKTTFSDVMWMQKERFDIYIYSQINKEETELTLKGWLSKDEIAERKCNEEKCKVVFRGNRRDWVFDPLQMFDLKLLSWLKLPNKNTQDAFNF